jgi:hypothetical protein
MFLPRFQKKHKTKRANGQIHAVRDTHFMNLKFQSSYNMEKETILINLYHLSIWNITRSKLWKKWCKSAHTGRGFLVFDKNGKQKCGCASSCYKILKYQILLTYRNTQVAWKVYTCGPNMHSTGGVHDDRSRRRELTHSAQPYDVWSENL